MNVVVLAFFDKYLKEIEDIDFIQKAKEYSEIEIVTNIDGLKDKVTSFRSLKTP